MTYLQRVVQHPQVIGRLADVHALRQYQVDAGLTEFTRIRLHRGYAIRSFWQWQSCQFGGVHESGGNPGLSRLTKFFHTYSLTRVDHKPGQGPP